MITIRINTSPLGDLFKQLHKDFGIEAVNQAHKSELPRTLRSAKTKFAQKIESGLKVGEEKRRMPTKISKRSGVGSIHVTHGASDILASRYKGKVVGQGTNRRSVYLKGTGGFRQVVSGGFYTRGRYTKNWLVEQKHGKIRSVFSKIDFGDEFIRHMPDVADEVLESHMRNTMNRIFRDAARGVRYG